MGGGEERGILNSIEVVDAEIIDAREFVAASPAQSAPIKYDNLATTRLP